MLQIVNTTLNGIHSSTNVMIILLTPSSVLFLNSQINTSQSQTEEFLNQNVLENFFSWFWSERFLNVIIYYEIIDLVYLGNVISHIISYTPFPKIQINDSIIELNANENLFPNRMQNIQGYTLKSPVKQDAPRSFTYTNKIGQQITGGITSKIYNGFIQYINATFEEIKIPNSSQYVKISEIVNLIYDNQVEISYHATSGSIFNHINYSYPYGKSLWCIMIPYSDEIPRSLYFLLPFQIEVWLTILALWIYQTIIESITNWIIKSELDVGRSLLNGLTKLLFIGSPTSVITKPTIYDFLVKGLETLMGFIISNFYLAFLSSFLSVTIFLPQITSWELLDKSSLKIQIIDYEMDQYYSTKPDIPEFLEKKFMRVERDIFAKNRNDLNKSYAYTTSTQAAKFLLEQQKFSSRPIFRSPDFCLSDDLLAFPIRADTPFYEAFEIFTMKILENGLQQFWELTSYEEAFDANILKKIEQETLHRQKLQFQHFLIAWICLIIGYISGTICFLWEFNFLLKFRRKLK